MLNFGLPAPIDVEIESNDLREGLHRGAAARAHGSGAIPGVVDVRISQVLDYPTLNLDVDRLRAAQVGLSQRDVANNLLTSLASSSLVAPNFWLSPQNNVNYIVAVQTPLPRCGAPATCSRTPLTSGGQPLPADSDADPHRLRGVLRRALYLGTSPSSRRASRSPRSTTPPSSG